MTKHTNAGLDTPHRIIKCEFINGNRETVRTWYEIEYFKKSWFIFKEKWLPVQKSIKSGDSFRNVNIQFDTEEEAYEHIKFLAKPGKREIKRTELTTYI